MKIEKVETIFKLDFYENEIPSAQFLRRSDLNRL